MLKKWQVSKKIEADEFKKFPEINPVILQLLYNRNLDTQKKIDGFLYLDYSLDQNDPFLFKDIAKAIKRIRQAQINKEKVIVYGDYDADGVCATCLMKEALNAIGISNLSIYIPHRETEGYGLNSKAIKRFIKEQVNLIITVDCGIANTQEVEQAQKSNIDIIITDHHAEPLVLPKAALAILDPMVKGETYPFTRLSGTGVAFKLAQALSREYTLGEGFEKWLLDLVAISTICDCMPLLSENRTLVKYGLIVLGKSRRLGLQSLLKSVGNNFSEVNEEIIGFRIGPRLNAAGRMDHANTAYQLLITNDQAEAEILTKQLNNNNTERQKITEKIVQEAKNQIHKKDMVLFAHAKEWPLGIVGLVAGKIADEFHRPTFILAENEKEISGSGRSIEQLNLIATIQETADLLSRYGGHSQACGFTLKNKKDLEEFKRQIRKLVEEKLAQTDLQKILKIESEIKLADINWDLIDNLSNFRPFGEGNPCPLFCACGLEVIDWQTVGKNSDHLRLIVKQGVVIHKAIAFGFGKMFTKINKGARIDLAFYLETNEWNGSKEIQIRVIDIKLPV